MAVLDQPRPGHGVSSALRTLQSEGVAVATLGFLAVVTLLAIPQELVQDTWLALVAGREVVEHGLPATDALNIWTRGVRWIDQQWLAQATLYELFRLGGIRLTMLAHVTLLTGTFAAAVVASRRLGGSTLSASMLAVAAVLVAPWALQVRAQTAAMPLFVGVLWLLARDSRTPSRSVYLALPLLAIWANVHGTVVLGAALVVVRGVTVAYEGFAAHDRRARVPAVVALTFGPIACLLATPYGLSIVGYYEDLLFNPLLREYVVEWKASTPSADTAAFYAYAAVAAALVVRHRRLLTQFELAALLVTLLGAFLAVRSILWFAIAGLVLLPPLVDRVLPKLPPFPVGAQLKAALAFTAIVGVTTTALAVATRDEGWFTQEWPEAAARQVAGAARTGSANVLSDERFADWLLWKHPELRGRIAYGVRFELFTERQFAFIAAYKRADEDGWHRVAKGYGVLVLDRDARSAASESQLAAGRYTIAYRDEKVSVLLARGG